MLPICPSRDPARVASSRVGMGLSVVAPPRRARRVDSLGGETATGAQLVPAEYRPRRRRDSASTECPRRDRGGAEDRAGISTMSFELKPTHPMPDDGVCFGGGKKVVDNIVWTETRDSVPGFLQSKVSRAAWRLPPAAPRRRGLRDPRRRRDVDPRPAASTGGRSSRPARRRRASRSSSGKTLTTTSWRTSARPLRRPTVGTPRPRRG